MTRRTEKSKIAEFCKSKNLEFLVWTGNGYRNVFSDEFIAPEELVLYQAPMLDSYSYTGSPESKLKFVSKQREIIDKEYLKIDRLKIGEGIKLEEIKEFIGIFSSEKTKYHVSGITGYGRWPGIFYRPFQLLTRREKPLEHSPELTYLQEELADIAGKNLPRDEKFYADHRILWESDLLAIGWREDKQSLSGGAYEDFGSGKSIHSSQIVPIGLPYWLGHDRNSGSICLKKGNHGKWVRFGQRLQKSLTTSRINIEYAINSCIGRIVPPYVPSPEAVERGHHGHEEYFEDFVVQPCFLLPPIVGVPT